MFRLKSINVKADSQVIMRTKIIAVVLIIVNFFCCTRTKNHERSQPLPWNREMSLKEASKSVKLKSTLDRTNPFPDFDGFGDGHSMCINNLKMRTTIWGSPDRITISLNKNNVWDRRLNIRSLQAPTLQDISEGVVSPANNDYIGIDTKSNSLRPKEYGYLRKEGGSYDPYRQPIEYFSPCLKPVGQIIVGIDPLKDAEAPQITQSCANGVTSLQVTKGTARASLEYVLGMKSNIYAIKATLEGISKPLWLRLYRHKDTAYQEYMTADGKTYTNPGAEADKAFNGPIDPPTSGKEGRYFWIRQRMPAEKTFPQGFEYVLMGVVNTPGEVKLETVEGKTGLGTPPPDAKIAAAPGAAATATFIPGSDGKLIAFVTIVTTMDGPDLLALAKKRLTDAEAGGFEGVVKENTKWWNDFYDLRENGRVFRGETGRNATDEITSIYRSWTDSHGGGTKTDMRQYEASASYGLPEKDLQFWTSLPCYNEIFTTNRFVRNWGDSEDMWKQIVEHWVSGAKQNAWDMFHLPGMFITHGYLPPVKPDKYIHTTITLELCLGTMAQIIRPAWDEWDYCGDTSFLRKECYPLMREMAIFYAGYAKRSSDGYYHIIPSMEEERWGFYPNFSHNKDVISSLCMFRWALSRAADAAEFLKVDDFLSKGWRQVASQIVPYPTWEKPEGPIFAGVSGVEPNRLPGDHFGDAASYPTVLADEINLDSSLKLKDMMIRTVKTFPSGNTNEALILLGRAPDKSNSTKAGLINPEADAETLLNSRSGRIHLFPSVSPDASLAFHNFQARGGFLVSACKDSNGVYYVEIQPRRDNQCRLINPWPGKSVTVHEAGKSESLPVEIDKSNGECLIFSTIANHKYLVELK